MENVRCVKGWIKGILFAGAAVFLFAFPQYVQAVESDVEISAGKWKRSSKVKGITVQRNKKLTTVKWHKVSKAAGYQFTFAASRDFKNKHTVRVTKPKASFKKSGGWKVYYIRVRAYTVLNGKTVYGTWSAKTKVKIKSTWMSRSVS